MASLNKPIDKLRLGNHDLAVKNLTPENVKAGVQILNVKGSYTPEPVFIEEEENANVRFIDYDGTIVAHYSKDDFLELTSLPANPTHTGLVSQGWNWSLADAKDYVRDYGILDIGQMYTTSDGATRLYVDITEYTLKINVTLTTLSNASITIDWGDETQNSYNSGSTFTHTYASAGSYVISIFVTIGSIQFPQCSGYSNYPLFWGTNYTGTSTPATNYDYSSRPEYKDCLKKIEVGANVSKVQSIYFYTNLDTITIPNTVTSLSTGSNTFGIWGVSLKCLIIPNSITTLGNNSLGYLHNMQFLSLPNSITGDFYIGGNQASEIQGVSNLRICVPSNAVIKRPTSNYNFWWYLYANELAGKTAGYSQYGPYTKRAYKKGGESGGFGYNINGMPLYTDIYLHGDKVKNIILNEDISNYGFTGANIDSISIGANAESIGTSAFAFSTLKNLVIENGVKIIWSNAFYRTNLRSVYLPKSVRTLKSSCFYYNYFLQKVEMKGVKEIESSVFYMLQHLSELILNEGLETIGTSAFFKSNNSNYYQDFPYFNNLIIPSTVTSIGNQAFQLGIRFLKFAGLTPPQFGSNCFSSSPHMGMTIYVPQGTLSAYQSATNAPTGTYIEYAYDTYNVTPTIINGTATGGSTITSMGGLELTLTADSGYVLPESVTVTNADYNYYPDTGELILFNAEDDVTVSITCVAE